MNYQGVYDYVETLTQNLGLGVQFFHGRKEWLNYINTNQPLLAFMLPLTSSGTFNESGNPQQVWALNIIFYQRDNADSAIDENNIGVMQEEVRTISITSKASDQFLRLFEFNDITEALEESSDLLSVTSFSTENAIKDTALMVTGTILTINFLVSDDFDYCC